MWAHRLRPIGKYSGLMVPGQPQSQLYSFTFLLLHIVNKCVLAAFRATRADTYMETTNNSGLWIVRNIIDWAFDSKSPAINPLQALIAEMVHKLVNHHELTLCRH